MITNDVKAGNYLAIGLDLGRVSQEQMTVLKTKLEATKAKLEVQNFDGLTKEDILGDLLYTAALFYYSELDMMDYVSSKTMGVAAIRLPSENIFSSELNVKTFWETPLSVNPGGLAMDVDRVIALVKALDGNKEKTKQLMMTAGQNSSALEHAVPEQLFSTADNPVEGISAIKALQIANDQGIPIYTINQSNINTILPQLQLDSGTIADIQNAVNAGKTVNVSKTDITFNGWTGCGYIIIDPNTGAGAYMISGGMNGAWAYWFAAGIASFALLFLYITTLLMPIFLAMPFLAILFAGMITACLMLMFMTSIGDTINAYQRGEIDDTTFDSIIAAKSMTILVGNMLPVPLEGAAALVVKVLKSIMFGTWGLLSTLLSAYD